MKVSMQRFSFCISVPKSLDLLPGLSLLSLIALTINTNAHCAEPVKNSAQATKTVLKKVTKSKAPSKKPTIAEVPDKTKDKTAEKEEPKKASEAPLKEVLEPSRFFGLAQFGYAAAKAAPAVMSKLFCYCGCDLTDSHNSLLDCFTSIHGVDCHICQEEAILAVKMHREGDDIATIQKAVDEKYAKDYPFEQDTAAYKLYKATHFNVKPGSGVTATPVKPGAEAAGPEDPDAVVDTKTKTIPKLKPGKKIPKCCAEDHEKTSSSEKKKTK